MSKLAPLRPEAVAGLSPEFYRWLTQQLIPRVGGPDALTNIELSREIYTIGSMQVDSIAGLQAIDPTQTTHTYLIAGGRSGAFKWQAGDYSTQVSADHQQALYIASTVKGTTDGAWCRVWDGQTLDGGWYGMDTEAADNLTAINAFLSAIKASAQSTVGTQFCKLSGRFPVGIYSYIGSINATSMRRADIDQTGCWLWNRNTDSVTGTRTICLDAAGSLNLRWNNLTVYADDAMVGVRISRWDDPGYTAPAGRPSRRRPSSWHKFIRPTVVGSFRRTTWYNCQSEGQIVESGYFQNSYSGAKATRDPASLTCIAVVDGYNEWDDVGISSSYAPLVVSAGRRSGTSNSIKFFDSEFRARDANIIPLYFNGARELVVSGYTVTGGECQWIMGDGGLDTSGDAEVNSYGIDLSDLHGEGYSEGEEETPIAFSGVFRAVYRDVAHSNFRHGDLTTHSTTAVFDIEGTKSVMLNRCDLRLNEGRVLAAYGTLMNPAKKTKFRATGAISIGPTTITRAPFIVYTTSGSSLVTADLAENNLAAGDLVNLQALGGGALLTVNGITLNGDYTIASATADQITLDAGMAATATGSGDAAGGGVTLACTVGRPLDLESCIQRFDGDIYAGIWARLVKLPQGNQRLFGDADTGDLVVSGGSKIVGRTVDSGLPSASTRIGTTSLPARGRTDYRLPYIFEQTIDPGAITVPATGAIVVTFTGLNDVIAGHDSVQIIPPTAMSSNVLIGVARVAAGNTVTVPLSSSTGSSISVSAGSWTLRFTR